MSDNNHFQCAVCELEFKNKASLANHRTRLHQTACCYCDARFDSPQELNRHKQDHFPNALYDGYTL